MIIIKSGSMHTLKILSTNYLTHDVKRFVVEKPKDFYYSPGHSAHISINVPGWEEEIRPFTFTSLNDWPHLEDRKSTRLNSSHVAISYAVFCLKKKIFIEK